MRDSTCFPTFRALTENKAILYTIIDVKVFVLFCFVFFCFFFFFQIYNIIAKHFFSLCGAFDATVKSVVMVGQLKLHGHYPNVTEI